MENLKAKSIQNSALWAAYGDALGFISELVDYKGLKRRINSSRASVTLPWKKNVGGQFGAEVDLPSGCYSDDTQLRLATCRAIRGDGVFDVEAFAKVELPVWTSYSLGSGVGTRLAATSLAHQDSNWFSNFFEQPRGKYIDCGGNGAAMRIQPHVWAAKKISAPETFIIDVIRNAVCTHGHPRGILGAVFHALCLSKSFELHDVPGPDFWKKAIEYFSQIKFLIIKDSELSSFWLPVWEERLGTQIEPAINKVQQECIEDLSIIEKYIYQKSEFAYKQMVESLGCLNSSSRGSGTKTAIIAVALAWMYKDENPSKAIEVAANLFFSDTDTIATMTGAILGVIAADPPSDNLLDREYIKIEANRLYEISSGNPQMSFAYPDLLHWQPPKTQLDAIGIVNNLLALAGLGIAKPQEKKYHSRSKNDFFWQWFELDFGQSMVCKRRSNLSSLLAGSIPSKLRSEQLMIHSSTYKKTESLIPSGLQSSSFKPSEKYISQTRTIDDLTKEAIKSDFDSSLIGKHLLELAEKPDGIELAISYTAIIVKAKMARLKAKREGSLPQGTLFITER